MSVIGTIQRKFLWLLIILLALAMLAFVLMDSSGPGGIQAGANKKVGEINGDKVKALDLNLTQQRIKEKFPRATDDQVREMAWREFIDESIFNPRYASLGIGVSDAEAARGIMSNDPHPIARQTFGNPDGTYDLSVVQQFLDSSEDSDGMITQMTDLIANDLRDQKYTSLLRQGINTPNWLAQIGQTTGSKTVDFDFVQLPYSLIGDEEVEVSDKEIEAHARENRGKYESRGGFVLQYVPFDIVPSKADSVKITDALSALKEEFATTEDVQFANRNSTAGVNPSAYGYDLRLEYNNENSITFEETRKNQLLNASVGDVIGPFVHNGYATLVKVEDKKTGPLAKVRHILISADSTNMETKKNLADSLAGEIRSDKSKFESFVRQYSEDPGSSQSGGVYDFFPREQMVPAFDEASFTNRIGSVDVVKTDFGFHIIEVLERKQNQPMVKLLSVMKGFRVENQTRTNILKQAQDFERNSKTEDDFIANAEAYGGVKTTPLTDPNANFIPGIGNNFSVLAWANNNSAGAVKLFTGVDNKDYVIRIDSKTKKGELDIEANRVAIANEVRKKKKAEILKQQVEDNGGLDQTLATLAQKLGRNVQTSTGGKFNSSGQGVGYEPELISRLFLKPVGYLPETFEGRTGVYIVDVKAFNDGTTQSLEQVKTSMANRVSGSINMTRLMQELEENGTIKDERFKLYQ